MLDISPYPLCAARLKFQFCKLSEPGFTKFWAAVNVATDIEDDALTQFGGFNFKDKSDANGDALLSRLEAFIRTKLRGRKAKSDIGGMTAPENSVRAFLGSNGVKVSKLSGVDDYWASALILWPDHIEANPKVRDLITLAFQINRVPKKARPKLAKAHLRNLPDGWCARNAAEQKLQSGNEA